MTALTSYLSHRAEQEVREWLDEVGISFQGGSMADNPMEQFAQAFKVVTGVSMEHAVDMQLAGKHEELLMEINTAIRNEVKGTAVRK